MAQPLDTVAIALYSSLTAGTTFDIPEFDVSGPAYDLPGGSSNPALVAIPKLTNADLKVQIEREKINNKEFIAVIEMLRDERDSLRNKHTGVTYTPKLKVIFELIKVWWVNKFTLK